VAGKLWLVVQAECSNQWFKRDSSTRIIYNPYTSSVFFNIGSNSISPVIFTFLLHVCNIPVPFLAEDRKIFF
jgi:hypothetical protein